MLTIKLDECAAGGYFVSWFTSDEAVFNAARRAFKSLVPSYAARYDGTARRWLVKSSALPGLLAFVDLMREDYYAEVNGDMGDIDECEDTGDAVAEAFATLYLLPDAPDELIRVAYKTLARLHHPDLGGTTEAMQRINAAYALLVSERSEARAA